MLSQNSGIRMKDYLYNTRFPWNLEYLCGHKFEADREEFMEKQAIKYMAVYRIKKWWLRLKYDPRTKIGRRYAMQLYNENFDSNMDAAA